VADKERSTSLKLIMLVNPSDWFNKSEEISVARNELKITLQNYEILFYQVFLLKKC